MKTKKVLKLLRDYESQNILFAEKDGSWPIVWERANGVHVWDAEGKKYLDLTAAFGVAVAGHANPNVVRAGQKQMAKLLHAMGDVHPHACKAQLAKKLSEVTFEKWSRGLQLKNSETKKGKVIFSNSGFEAVESALKTAMLVTKKNGVIAFEGGYHGLGYGALNATHREHFRAPFRSQLREFANFAKFPLTNNDLPALENSLREIFRRKKVGAILVEPVQARGGINIPPKEFLPLLRKLCDEFGALLILDEIYTGFGRTGKMFACEHSQTIPDLICLGKALTGGFPLSACVGRADLMDAAWPASSGEAIHTSTFLGHPVGCAMALAQISEIERLNLCERSAELGTFLLDELNSLVTRHSSLVTRHSSLVTRHSSLVTSIRGLGLMIGVELILPDGKPATQIALDAIKKLLHRGFIFLPEGEFANVISFTPPLTISKAQLANAVRALAEVLR
jgi:4-aminobutyrate aminotransferase-like enzyme